MVNEWRGRISGHVILLLLLNAFKSVSFKRLNDGVYPLSIRCVLSSVKMQSPPLQRNVREPDIFSYSKSANPRYRICKQTDPPWSPRHRKT